jgi:hypothetical protein
LVLSLGFITWFLSFLPAEPESSIKASDAVPEMALLDATLDGESPAHDGSDPTYGVEDGGQGQLSANKLGCAFKQ